MKEITWTSIQLVEWEHEAGLTNFSVNTESGVGSIFMLVPFATDGPSRTVRRHELLHATYDRPDIPGSANYRAADNQQSHSELQDNIHNAVGDAFVHLVYWPEEWAVGPERDDAVEMAMKDIKRLSGDEKLQESDTNWSAVYLMTLRSMAVLKRVGTVAEQLEGSVEILKYLGKPAMDELDSVLDLVADKDRKGALNRFAEITAKFGETSELPRELLALLAQLRASIGEEVYQSTAPADYHRQPFDWGRPGNGKPPWTAKEKAEMAEKASMDENTVRGKDQDSHARQEQAEPEIRP